MAKRMTARFPGWCRACKSQFPSGTEIFHEPGAGSRHVTCPPKTPAAPLPEGVEGPPVTAAIRVSKSYAAKPGDLTGRIFHHRTHGWLVVQRQSARFIREDGLSFGLDDDRGWLVTLDCRPATEEEQRPLVEATETISAAAGAIAAAEARLRDIKMAILRDGDRPERLPQRPAGELLMLGKGYDEDEMVLAADGIWLITYNGRDGDCWSWNNLGGHSIAARAWPFPELADELRELHRTIVAQRARRDQAHATLTGVRTLEAA